MRTIKFRGKSVEKNLGEVEHIELNLFNGWAYGSLITSGSQSYIVGSVVESCSEYINLEYWVPVDTESVGQYTGLKDKNDVEIYEGDIVRYIDFGTEFISEVIRGTEKGTGYYVRCSGKGYYAVNPSCIKLYKFEVIGNIHDNPELLKP